MVRLEAHMFELLIAYIAYLPKYKKTSNEWTYRKLQETDFY